MAGQLMLCAHAPYADPRHPHECLKCGRPIELDARAAGRDAEYERLYLNRVVEEAERRFAINATPYVGAVRQRLAIGAERYGDNDFLSKDNMTEVAEETPDVCAYSLLETQKQLASGEEVDENRVHHLFEASVLAACADWHVRQALRGS